MICHIDWVDIFWSKCMVGTSEGSQHALASCGRLVLVSISSPLGYLSQTWRLLCHHASERAGEAVCGFHSGAGNVLLHCRAVYDALSAYRPVDATGRRPQVGSSCWQNGIVHPEFHHKMVIQKIPMGGLWHCFTYMNIFGAHLTWQFPGGSWVTTERQRRRVERFSLLGHQVRGHWGVTLSLAGCGCKIRGTSQIWWSTSCHHVAFLLGHTLKYRGAISFFYGTNIRWLVAEAKKWPQVAKSKDMTQGFVKNLGGVRIVYGLYGVRCILSSL